MASASTIGVKNNMGKQGQMIPLPACGYYTRRELGYPNLPSMVFTEAELTYEAVYNRWYDPEAPLEDVPYDHFIFRGI